MTNEETQAVRKALRPRKGFDDYLMYGTWVVGGTAFTYWAAHALAALIN